jgi:hypothetical protein
LKHPLSLNLQLLADKMLGLTATTVLALCAGGALAQTPIRVASFNIRYDNTDISIADTELYWSGLTCASDPYQCRVFGVLSELGTFLASHSRFFYSASFSGTTIWLIR